MLRSARNVRMTRHDDTYPKLIAEGAQLRQQRDSALAAHPQSETYRQYVARMQAHIAALAGYLNISRT